MTAFKKFALLITTKDRRDDLMSTLQQIAPLLKRDDVRCIVCDDGSSDGTTEAIQGFPQVETFRHETSQGYLYSRNKLLQIANAEYGISLDDDAHFLSEDPLKEIEKVFRRHPSCGVVAFRIFWGKQPPISMSTDDTLEQVKSFVGCGHAWRLSAWKNIPPYPEWFQFYGEEDYASYELFKAGLSVIYAPQILVHHRVDLTARKNLPDYGRRLQRSLASGWYLYFLFYPMRTVFRKFGSSIASQLRTRIFKGDFVALRALLGAMADLLIAIPKIISNSNRFGDKEFAAYKKLSNAKIFWKPKDDIGVG